MNCSLLWPGWKSKSGGVSMWLIALLWAVLIMNFALDLLERKQKGESIEWRNIRGDFFAVAAFGVIVGGGYGFLQMFPAIGKKPFPHWLGFGLAAGLFLFMWFAATVAIIQHESNRILSPLEVVNEAVGEEQLMLLGVLAILGVGAAFLRFEFPLWAGFILLLPVWGIVFYLWGLSNWILAWVLLRLRNSRRQTD